MPDAPPALDLVGVRRAYGSVVAVDGIALSVERGEFVTLLGPSGSGKTTTLRLIGGFERLDAGSIRIHGERIDHLPPYQRDTATIFQSGALFPHKSVAENVAYGLRMRKIARAERDERIRQTLNIVRLSGLEARYPRELSGGQKQRVALARSLAVRPAILLFDEPLSALDLSLRLQLRGEIKHLHDELGFSAIYVTHDQSEAIAMSDRVAVMNRGRIEQIAPAGTVFHHPANEFVHTFIGESCCLPVSFRDGTVRDASGQAVDLSIAEQPGQGSWRLYVRPSRFRLGGSALGCENRLKATVRTVEFLGEGHRYHLSAGALEISCDEPGPRVYGSGDPVDVGWSSADMRAYS